MNKEFKRILLDLLIDLDRVCKTNGLRYYLAFGTCLGAVRHKGFIPWDHDVDVLMPIEDAKKLVGLQSKFKKGFFLQSKDTDPQFDSIAYKLRDSNTCFISSSFKNERYNQGIFIDIYPYYDCPPSNIDLQLNIWRSYLYRVLVYGKEPKNHSIIYKMITRLILMLCSGARRTGIIRKMEQKLTNVRDAKEILDYYGEDIGLFHAITYDKKWFGKPSQLTFEGYTFDGPTDCDNYLKKRYGDYMKLPPKEKQVSPFDFEDMIIDTKKSYLKYYEEWDKLK